MEAGKSVETLASTEKMLIREVTKIGGKGLNIVARRKCPW